MLEEPQDATTDENDLLSHCHDCRLQPLARDNLRIIPCGIFSSVPL